eukprot:427742-Prorocentrum_minimum.AAC.5
MHLAVDLFEVRRVEGGGARPAQEQHAARRLHPEGWGFRGGGGDSGEEGGDSGPEGGDSP